MAKMWIIELEDEHGADSVAFELECLPQAYHVKLTEYPSNPMEPIKEVYEDLMKEPCFYEDRQDAIWK